MTKQEAAEKVAKLMRLAKSNSNPHEASTARSQAKKIVKEYELTASDLSTGKKAQAFDALVEALKTFIASCPVLPPGLFNTSGVISDILQKLTSMKEVNKATQLDKVAGVIESAHLIEDTLRSIGFAKNDTVIQKARKILNDILEAHGLEKET